MFSSVEIILKAIADWIGGFQLGGGIDAYVEIILTAIPKILSGFAEVVLKVTPRLGGLGTPMLHMAGTAWFLIMAWWFFEEHTRG